MALFLLSSLSANLGRSSVLEKKRGTMHISTPLSGELGQYLDLSSAELKLTAENMANVNTPGYTREVAVFDENVPITISGLNYGTGASVTEIQSQRDRVL